MPVVRVIRAMGAMKRSRGGTLLLLCGMLPVRRESSGTVSGSGQESRMPMAETLPCGWLARPASLR